MPGGGMYDQVRALRPRRSVFNLSYEKKLTCDLGQLVPVMCDEVVPGDSFQIGIEAVVRFLPMVAPILHEINTFVHYFFVPYRLLSDDWENFITGGIDGEDVSVMPRWEPTGGNVTNQNGVVVADNGVGSLWDLFGFPVGIIPDDAFPLAFPRAAYNLIWNQYYRDETQMAELALTSSIVCNRCWQKDYLTSALPFQQRGIAPALPIAGTSSAVFPANVPLTWPSASTGSQTPAYYNDANKLPFNTGTRDFLMTGYVLKADADDNTVDLSDATAFDVSDLRLAFQIQKWMERNARGGARYTEFLRNHFGVSPRDDRLQRAEYIGGTKLPVIVSEVLQTSSTDGTSPQGNMAGHGLSAGRDFCAKYYAQEYGLIIGIMSIMPRGVYSQGINRQWLRTTRYDFYSPEWAHLSEQAVYRAEVYAQDLSASNLTIFGYQGRFNEMRSKESQTVGLMRVGVSGSLGFWHLARNFSSAPALNETFLRCIPRKDYLAAPSQPAVIVNIANVIKAIRPMPIEAAPGLIDHS